MNFKQINWEKVSWVLAIEVGAIMVVAALFLSGGMDIRLYFQPFARGCLDCGFVPYYVQPMLAPLLLTSIKYVWSLWMLISVAGLLLLARQTKINPLVFMLSFPMIGQFWLGQIDVLICLGAFLAITHKNSYMRGLGILLLMVKPQIAILAVIFLLVREDRSQLLRVLAVPAGVFALSLLVYGIGWPVEWIANALHSIPDHPWKLPSQFFWPWALVLLPLPFMFNDRREGTIVSFLVSAVAMPFFSLYSYIVFLIFYSPWWALPLSYAYMIFRPWLGDETMKMAWILPVTLLAVFLSRRFEFDQVLAKRIQKPD